jgi:PAS domain S-box-containing protein
MTGTSTSNVEGTRDRGGDDDRLMAIIASATDAIITVDGQQRVTLFNAAAERMFACPASEAIGQPLDRFIPERYRAIHREHVRNFGATGVTARSMGHQRPLAALRGDGVEFPIEATISQVTVGGQPLFTAIVRDVTERCRAEEALRDREARLRAVINTAVDAIVTIDARGVIDSVNPAAERLFGYRAQEMVGRNVSMLMPAPYAAEHDRYIGDYLRTGRAKIIGIGREVVALRKDGTAFPIDLAVSEFDAGGGRRMFAGIAHDLTGRRRLEREILEAGAAEQRRIGRELHDGLCQQLTALSFAAELLARKLTRAGGPAAAAELLPTVRTIADELDRAMTETRSLARGLNPVDIRAGGLSSALADLAERASATFGVHCRFRPPPRGAPGAEIDDNGTATHLFRIAQEAVANAVRHGKAAHVDISLAAAPPGTLTLTIADDGAGFSAAGLPREHPGIGLRTMEYRARVIGGTLHVGPGPHGTGTAVSCVIQSGGGGGGANATSARASSD